jgi:hypothetical protein
VAPLPSSARGWTEALPAGVAQRVAERLLAQAADGEAARREVAVEALSRLLAMARRAQP